MTGLSNNDTCTLTEISNFIILTKKKRKPCLEYKYIFCNNILGCGGREWYCRSLSVVAMDIYVGIIRLWHDLVHLIY